MAHMGFCDKHNMVAFLQKPTGSEEFHQIVDFLAGSHIRYALTANSTIYVSLIGQFWQTATVETGRMEETEYEDVEEEYAEVEYDMDQTDLLQHVTPTKAKAPQILADASKERVKTYNRRRRSTDSSRDSTAGGTVGGLFSIAEEIQGKTQIVQERQSGSVIRYHTLKKKPVTVAQARKNMMTYLKNMDGYKMGNFKGMSYDEIRPIFEKEYNKVQTLFKKDTEVGKTEKKRVAEETLLQESFKKLRIAEASSSEPIQEQPTGEPKELSEEELKKMMEIVPIEKIKAEALQVKYPIID
ncbi:hypothetical protein Tco_0369626 [Tanacetum coccineum]